MSLKFILRLIAVVAIVWLIIQVIGQVRHINAGASHLGKRRVLMNWLLLIVIVGCLGGAHFADGHAIARQRHVKVTHQTKVRTKRSVTVKKTAKPKASATIKYPHEVELQNGRVQVTFEVPKGALLTIYEPNSSKVLKQFDNRQGTQTIKVNQNFTQAAEYVIEGVNGKLKKTSKLTVKAPAPAPAAQSRTTNRNSSSQGYHYEERRVLVPNGTNPSK